MHDRESCQTRIKSLRNEKEFETKMQKNKNWNNINKDKNRE